MNDEDHGHELSLSHPVVVLIPLTGAAASHNYWPAMRVWDGYTA